MSTGSTPNVSTTDIAGQILISMRTMGIAPIPRNYNLFYEAYIGSNPALSKELMALGGRATQEELDAIASRYFDHNSVSVIELAHQKLHGELEALLLLLRHEQSSLEQYNRLLDETRERITDKNAAGANILKTAINLLVEATGDKIAQGETTSRGFHRHSEEMQQVRQELDAYKKIANTDSLTRLANRRAFDEKLACVYDNSIGLHLSALVLLDIDNFKRINDTYGHPVGDKILASVASVLRANVRKDVFVARSGGEEFAILIDNCSSDEIRSMCERVRQALERTPFRNSKSGTDYGQVTISIGIAMASQAENSGDLYARADTALYMAKETGRNRTVSYEDGMKKNAAGKNWLIYNR